MSKKVFGSFVATFLVLAAGTANGASCFTVDEAKDARFRVFQQMLNVAALNCRTVDPAEQSFQDRYNRFVGRFDGPLKENAVALKHHFAHSGGNLDLWMTKVANDAGQRVFSDPNYCQTALEYLDQVVTLNPGEIREFATAATPAHAYISVCAPAKAKLRKAAMNQ